MRTLFASLLVLVASTAFAEPYAVGSTLPPIELPDQHGELRKLDESVRAIVFTRDMKAGDVAKAAVEKAGPDLFDRNSAVYIVDVKGMPSLVKMLFARPAMKRRPYRLLVDDVGDKTADIPGGATFPTVLVLDKLRVTGIENPTSVEALIAALEKPAK